MSTRYDPAIQSSYGYGSSAYASAPPQSQHPLASTAGGYSLADDINGRYSDGYSSRGTQPQSWAERKGILILAVAGLSIYSLHLALSCTSIGLAKIFFSYQWQASQGEDAVRVWIGSAYRVACVGSEGGQGRNATCQIDTIAANNFGGASWVANLQYWLAAHVGIIIVECLTVMFLLFAPHPRNDNVLDRYKWVCRIAAVSVTIPLGLSYMILAFLANNQLNSQLGYASCVLEHTSAILVAWSLIWASRLTRDPDWCLRDDARKQYRTALSQERRWQRQRDQQQKNQGRAFQKILGEQGMRALALRKLVNTTSAPQQAPQVVFSQPPVAYPAPVQYYEPAPVAVPQAYTAPAYYNQGYGY